VYVDIVFHVQLVEICLEFVELGIAFQMLAFEEVPKSLRISLAVGTISTVNIGGCMAGSVEW